MIKIKSTLSTVVRIIALILIVFFFAFLLTYDFSLDSESIEDIPSAEKVSDEFETIINNSYENIKPLNILEVDLTNDFVNDLISYFFFSKSNDSEKMFETDYWSLRDLNVEFEEDIVILNIHITYKKHMNYKIKIKAVFDFTEYEDSYILSLKSLQFGNIYLRERNLKRILNNDAEGSIGNIFKSTLDFIFVGEYNIEELEYKIYKAEIINNLKTGVLSDIIFRNDDENKIANPVIETLFKYSLISISMIKDNLKIQIEYFKLINKDETISDIKDINDISTDESESLKYDLALSSLIGNDEIDISNDDLNECVAYTLKSIYSQKREVLYIYGVNSKILNDEIRISLVLSFVNEKILLDYFFLNDNNSFILNRIEIGRDNNEKESSYLTIDNDDLLIGFLDLLYEDDSGEKTITKELNILGILQINNFDIDSIKTDGDEIKVNVKTNNTMVENDLLSEELNNYIGMKSIDYSNKESLISSFNKLSVNDKIFYFKKIKDYYKDTISVYNYICTLID